MRYEQEVVVDGEHYLVHQFPATKAMKMLTRIVKLIGEPVSVLSDGFNSDAKEILPKAVRALAERLDENVVEQTVKDLLRSVFQGGTCVADRFDTHFQGRIGHMFKLLAEVLRYQYGDFLAVLAASAPREVAKASSPQSTSTGQSGDL